MPSTSPAQIERHRSPGAAPLDAPCDIGSLDVLDPDCPSRIVFGRIGERWSMFVILALAGGTLRFTQLRAKVGVFAGACDPVRGRRVRGNSGAPRRCTPRAAEFGRRNPELRGSSFRLGRCNPKVHG